jgi:predicted negative regulator of RcsB-dependent stress response|tara:strand:- start:38565 stop:39200 length:636 start_codon:yes stop_codon:yes gene_type:complete
VAEYETEEEQVEALKAWWKKNGKAVIAGGVMGIASIFGWKYWGHQQDLQSLAGSDKFNEIRGAILLQDLEAIALQATDLKENYSESSYATLGALMLAKVSVQNEDYSAAAENLKWVIANAEQEALVTIASLRLLRLLLMEGELVEAEALLEADYPQAYSSLIAELKGDLWLQKGDKQAAYDAYQEALQAADSSDVRFIQMKQDNLGIIAKS